MQWILSLILGMIAMFGLLEKAGMFYGWQQLILPFIGAWDLHTAVFGEGKGWYCLLPFLITILSIFYPLIALLLLLWHIIFSFALAKAFGETKVFALILIFLPLIGMIILGWNKSEYYGPVEGLFEIFR